MKNLAWQERMLQKGLLPAVFFFPLKRQVFIMLSSWSELNSKQLIFYQVNLYNSEFLTNENSHNNNGLLALDPFWKESHPQQ